MSKAVMTPSYSGADRRKGIMFNARVVGAVIAALWAVSFWAVTSIYGDSKEKIRFLQDRADANRASISRLEANYAALNENVLGLRSSVDQGFRNIHEAIREIKK
jgi:hypothetical protein